MAYNASSENCYPNTTVRMYGMQKNGLNQWDVIIMAVLKAINFDFDTKALQKYYPYPNWRKAYEDIPNWKMWFYEWFTKQY